MKKLSVEKKNTLEAVSFKKDEQQPLFLFFQSVLLNKHIRRDMQGKA